MKIVINTSYSQPFIQSVIKWFKKHGIELPKDADETFFERHDPILVKCVEELPNVLNYLEIVNIKGNIYRINYDYENCCEYVEEPHEVMTWICASNKSTLIIEQRSNTCSKTGDCPYCYDDDDKKTIEFNPKWCEHCSNNPTAHFLQIKEVKKDVDQSQEEFNKLIIETAERIERE